MVMPCTLNKPAIDVQGYLDETRLYVTSPPMPLQEILASLMECSVVDYCEQICRWLHDNATHVLMIEKWLAVQGISLQDYLQILGDNGSSDGLKVWAALMALNWLVNVVISDTIWSTTHEGLDFAYPTILLTSFEHGMLCALEEQEWDLIMATAPPPPPVVTPIALRIG